MEQNNKYEFRALTIKGVILIFILIVPVFFTIYLLMDKFIFYDIKHYNVFTNMKVIGIPIVLTYLLMTITSNYIVGNKYLIEINDNIIRIYKDNKIFHLIELNQLQKVEFNFNAKQKNGCLAFHYNNLKIGMFSGVLLTKKKDFIIVNDYFDTILYRYLLDNDFSEKTKKHKYITTFTLTKKD